MIRDEEKIDVSTFLGTRQMVAQDATRVAKGEVIASYLLEEETEYKKKIAALDAEIQELMEKQQIVYSADVKNIETEIFAQIYGMLRYKNNLFAINETKKSFDKNLEKKASMIGERSPTGSKLNQRIEERLEYERKLGESKKDLLAEKAGLISYRIDGYENIFTPNSFSKLKIEDFQKMKIGVNQSIPISDHEVKWVNNFYCYIALIMKSEESKKLNLNDTIKISLNGNFDEYIKASVEYILDENEERVVVLKITSDVEKLTQYRKVRLDVIWWNYQGLKVPNSAIYDAQIPKGESGESYATVKAVKVQEAGYQKEVWVKVEKSSEDFSIIENYSEEELMELGVPESVANEKKEVSLYDEILLQ